MVRGIGTDITDIMRTGRLTEASLNKIFHPLELEAYKEYQNAADEIKYQFLASRYAVKEAYAKARGLGFCDIIIPKEICTLNNEKGYPVVTLYGKTAENAPDYDIMLTISHSMPHAIAVLILQDK